MGRGRGDGKLPVPPVITSLDSRHGRVHQVAVSAVSHAQRLGGACERSFCPHGVVGNIRVDKLVNGLRHLDDERVVAIHATGRHQVGGGVSGMGALVVPGLPAINERLEELGIGHDRPLRRCGSLARHVRLIRIVEVVALSIHSGGKRRTVGFPHDAARGGILFGCQLHV